MKHLERAVSAFVLEVLNHASAKARTFYSQPLLTWRDLPEPVTARCVEVLAAGRRIYSCNQWAGSSGTYSLTRMSARR